MSDGSVFYLTKRFPRLSETFILHEILGLEAAGVPLRVFALADAGEALVQPEVDRLRLPVTYLRAGRGLRCRVSHVVTTSAAHVRLAADRPARYAAVLSYVLVKRRHLSTLRHFVEAGLLADLARRGGARHVHGAFAHGPASVAHLVHLLTGLPFSFAGHAKDLYVSAPDLLARKAAAASFVLACSRSAADYLSAAAGPAAAKVVLAPHGVDTDRFCPARNEPSPGTGTLQVLAVGRLTPKKGYPVLLEALALLDAAGHRVCCRVVGSGEQRDELQAIVAALGLGERVELIGSRTQEEVAALCRSAAVFVQASVVLDNGDRDGIPNALLEAMASGLAVVGSAVGGIPEVVEHEVTGLLVPPSDPAALAAAIAGLDDDRVALARLGAAARSHVVLNLSRRALVGSIVPLFASRREPTPVGP
ncbi:MAG: glycosyltransferase [Acidimicrobiales bacterium]